MNRKVARAVFSVLAVTPCAQLGVFRNRSLMLYAGGDNYAGQK